MKAKKWLALALMLSLMSTVTAFADSGTYDGYNKVKVQLNDQDVPNADVPGFVIDGSTVLPVRQLTDSLHALLHWDSSSRVVSLYKPNVSMLFAEGVSDDLSSIKSMFSVVKQGKKLPFYVVLQVDNLKTSISGFKISVIDPDGSEVFTSNEESDAPGESFWYSCPVEMKFSEIGNYTVRLSFLYDGEYKTVAEKLIRCE